MTSTDSENILDEFTKTSKIEPSLKILNADLFQFSAKTIKIFVLGG